MLKQLTTEAAQRPILFAFVRTKLSDKALEAIRATDDTIDLIIASLRKHIKPESSNVVKGKLTALRLANKTTSFLYRNRRSSRGIPEIIDN